MTIDLLHIGLDDGSRRPRTPDLPLADDAKEAATALRGQGALAAARFSVAPVAAPPGGFVFDVQSSRGIALLRCWVCFHPALSPRQWRRVGDEIKAAVGSPAPESAPWLATALRAAGLPLIMADPALRGAAEAFAASVAWGLITMPHSNEETVMPTRRPPPRSSD